ncbi:hypothetical protein SGO26_26080 [Cupriavidus metallidurans]|uniref:hypothetical protein n=1 Tax=Cupriavidus TaxID=106589 RepID=UPI0002A224E9|nr:MULTISPECIES: hypothetical protein [Cupriavidus]EKZ98551.1 hypothetical protein D769_14678 [Cupriavidus sp. HMR-1]HBD36476.1 hypothetical protein [Cupriavidus sp.]
MSAVATDNQCQRSSGRFVRICEQICHFTLWILPACFLLFFTVLFLIWQRPTLGCWFAPVAILLMAAATGAFMVASLVWRTRYIDAGLPAPASAPTVRSSLAAVPIRLEQMRTRTCSGQCRGAGQFSVACFHAQCDSAPDSAGERDGGP